MLGYPPTPPPRGAQWLTARPADPQGLGQPREGGSPPPPPYNPQNGCTPRGHTLAGGGPSASGVPGWCACTVKVPHGPHPSLANACLCVLYPCLTLVPRADHSLARPSCLYDGCILVPGQQAPLLA